MDKGRIKDIVFRGVAVGLAASIIQVMIGKAEEKLLPLPRHEDANIAPRLIDRVAEFAGVEATDGHKWGLGTLFHLGYGAFWGAGYALAVQNKPVSPLVGGSLLGGLIYALAFPKWGAAVLTKTERPPEARTPKMNVVAWSVALGYGLATGILYDLSRPRK